MPTTVYTDAKSRDNTLTDDTWCYAQEALEEREPGFKDAWIILAPIGQQDRLVAFHFQRFDAQTEPWYAAIAYPYGIETGITDFSTVIGRAVLELGQYA